MPHTRRKDHYNKKTHGQLFKTRDLVWLHSPAVLRGKSKKLHHPWSGPYRVITKISESDYWIEKLKGNRRLQIVLFKHLKAYLPGTWFDDQPLEHETDEVPESSDDGPNVFR